MKPASVHPIRRARGLMAARSRATVALGDARAHGIVHRAISRGQLHPASDQRCDDCGRAAECYDHRDYKRPLMVAPVCRSCNKRRGPGAAFDPEGASLLMAWFRHLRDEMFARIKAVA